MIRGYLSYNRMRVARIHAYIRSFIYPTKQDKSPFVFTHSYFIPMYKLIYEFAHVPFVENDYYAACITKEDSHYLLGIWNYNIIKERFLDTNIIKKEQLYELENYVISKFKPDYTFENKVYDLEKQLIPHVDKLFEFSDFKILRPLKPLTYISCKFISYNTQDNEEVFNKISNYTVRYYYDCAPHRISKRDISISTASIMLNLSLSISDVHFNYHPNVNLFTHWLDRYNISIDTDNIEMESKRYIPNMFKIMMDKKLPTLSEFRLNYGDDENILSKYDIAFNSKHTMSLYSPFINLIEDSDQRTIRKCIYRGIIDGDIFYTEFGGFSYNGYDDQHSQCIKLGRLSVSENMIDRLSCLLLYYASKNIGFSMIYWFSKSYPMCNKIIEDNKDCKIMLLHELNFIYKCFGYNNTTNGDIFILIHIPTFRHIS